MLEEKLQQASQASQKQSQRTLLWVTLVLMFSVVAVVLMTMIGSETSEPVASQSPSVVLQTQTPVQMQVPIQDMHQQGLREAVMKRLQAFEEEQEPALASANLEQWKPEKNAVLHTLKEDVLSSFAKGDYALASQRLDQLALLAQQLLAEWGETFVSETLMAENALKNDDYVAGKLHVTKALLLKPDEPGAKNLLKKLEALPELLALLKRADVARIENNFEKELTVLEHAFAIAPDRNGLKQRKDMLAETLKERRFSQWISSAWQALEKNDINTARLNYHQAKRLYAKRGELKPLNDAIAKTSARLDLKQSLSAAGQMIRQDEWLKAERIYAKSLQRHPQDKTLRDGLQLATKVVSLQAALNDYITRSDRLSAQNISAAAKDTLIQAEVFARNSKRLSFQITKLKTLLAKVNIKRAVMVKSDNNTFILVRGVGKVGLTPGREIQLKAGEYTFEGSRPGYKSKLVQVRVPIDGAMIRVEVICDERI
ncbi:MAG: hypothetical protein Q9M17_02175 [Mariprofundus sp.]|nr:hypothetical protein [Mariprofundus sp.]